MKGRSSPNTPRMRATSSGRALSPSTEAAGSWPVTVPSRNVMNVVISRTGRSTAAPRPIPRPTRVPIRVNRPGIVGAARRLGGEAAAEVRESVVVTAGSPIQPDVFEAPRVDVGNQTVHLVGVGEEPGHREQ